MSIIAVGHAQELPRPTSAVAIIELLIAFNADPTNNGVVNRHENGLPVTLDGLAVMSDVMGRSGEDASAIGGRSGV
ncbi:hypothetical protein GCM10027414_29770 [Humibacter ginsengiterrae]